MTDPTYLRYICAPGYGCYLHHLFFSLQQGGKSEADALATVAWVLANDKTITPPMPPGARPELKNGSLVLVAPNGTFSAAGYFIPRLSLPLDLPAAPKAVATAKEEDATEWVAARLKGDDSVRRDDLKDDCIKAFQISERTYKHVVWPAARVKAGLPREGKSGRPKKK